MYILNSIDIKYRACTAIKQNGRSNISLPLPARPARYHAVTLAVQAAPQAKIFCVATLREMDPVGISLVALVHKVLGDVSE